MENKNKIIDEKIKKPFHEGYYLEAFGQLDLHIDDLLFHILDHQVKYDKLSALLRTNGGLRGYNLAIILTKLEIISLELNDKIHRFKEIRNKISHSITSEIEIVLLSEKVKRDKKNLINNGNWDILYKEELQRLFNLGLDAYKELIAILSKLPTIQLTDEQLRKEIEEVYKK